MHSTRTSTHAHALSHTLTHPHVYTLFHSTCRSLAFSVTEPARNERMGRKCYIVRKCVTMRCSALQCNAVYCGVWQCVVVVCIVLQGARAHTHARTHTHVHTRTHMHTNTHTHTRTQTKTHTLTQLHPCSPSLSLTLSHFFGHAVSTR